MKKNKMLRIASVLLVAVLLTTCAISGTFAKYTTSKSAADEARVAKWGVEVTAVGNDAFATKYEDAADANGTKVISDVKVVAPGTNGQLGKITIEGEPEVMVNVDVNATLTLEGWEVDGLYCPLVFTVGGETFKIGDTYADVAALSAAITAKFNELDGTFDAGDDLAAEIEISWEWPFNDAADAISENDTALGNLADAPTIKFACDVTVSQIN